MKALVALVAVVLGVACVGPLSEMKESQYPSADAARAADPSGWIPDILPTDATSIREVHYIDSTRTWGCFQAPAPEGVRALLTRLNAHKAPGPIASGPAELFRDFSWWPSSMRTGAVEAWEFRDPPGCSACSAPAVVRVGIDIASGTVCFHRT
jgi:hypothetical protein